MTAVTGWFLPPHVCAAIVREAELHGWWQWGEVNYGGASEVDLTLRRTQWTRVPDSCETLIASRLSSISRSLERVFGPLRSLEGPNLLRYRPGDYFRPHPDEDPRTRVRPRRVTLSASLNQHEFSGGVLRLHGSTRHGMLSAPPEVGRFIAFPSRTVHEVTPISQGSRYALVAWLH
jgi:predicted 2-oxoglutarate/Fe(II)-dependent dioxygenase YbiX